MRQFKAPLLLLAVALASCGAPSPGGQDSAEAPGVGVAPEIEAALSAAGDGAGDVMAGTAVAAGSVEANALVAVYMKSGGGYYFICSGTLIRQDLVLTAAHCFADANAGGITKMRYTQAAVGIGTQGLRPSRIIDAAQILVNPGFKLYYTLGYLQTPNDVAILKLAQSAPATMKPAVLSRDGISTGQGLSAAGYGINVEGGALNGQLMKTTLKFWFQDWVNNLVMSGSKTGICSGDSGGALYKVSGTTMSLAGVTSWGTGCYSNRDTNSGFVSAKTARAFAESKFGPLP